MVTAPLVYAQCGLRIRSELPLDLPVVDSPAWDVELTNGAPMEGSEQPPAGTLVAERVTPDGAGWWYRATETPDGYVLRFVRVGDVLVSRDLTRIVVRPDVAGRAHLFPVLVAGTVSAFVLSMRGDTVLHASAVAVDGTALAFVGPSGAGKTTLATLMCLAGASIVADDVLTVEPGPPASCEGGASELRLREAASILADEQAPASTRRTTDDRLALSVAAATTGRLPLGAILFPGPSRTASAVELQPVPPAQALMALLSLSRVEGWSDPTVIQRDFQRVSALIGTVPTYRAVVPWGPPFLPSVAPALAALALRRD